MQCSVPFVLILSLLRGGEKSESDVSYLYIYILFVSLLFLSLSHNWIKSKLVWDEGKMVSE